MADLLQYQNLLKAPRRRPIATFGENEARFDNYGHFVEPTPNNERKRCAGERCLSRVCSQSCKCKVRLCI